MKQALTEALAADNRNFLVHTDYDGSWEFSDDAELIFAAARLVERLLPGECPDDGTVTHVPNLRKAPNYHDGPLRVEVCSTCLGSGRVWDEGIVEAVAKALFIEASSPGFAWISPTNMPEASFMRQARAVLSAITQLAEAGSR